MAAINKKEKGVFPMIASYFHKGLMWRGVKVEKSRKNGFSYDKAIFWQNL